MGDKRRIDVMLSSTFFDLEEHRAAVIAAMNEQRFVPLAMELDAALAGSDLIKASLDKVDAADAYIGLIGSRYGQCPDCRDRNPEQLSLSELEFRRAVERQLPICMFLIGPGHALTMADLERCMAEGDEAHAKLLKFIELAKQNRIWAEFNSPDDLKAKATTSLVKLRETFDQPANPKPPGPDDSCHVAPPAFAYVRKPYIPRRDFAGRATELNLIDSWANDGNPLLLFQAIGGMGKSALTWHWIKNRANQARSDWAGQLWYSFYEQGADLNDFCVHALAYIRHEPPGTYRGRSTLDLGWELRRELDVRPFLLVMDGLERVLVAYNRAGKEHMTDEEAAVVRDDMGLDRSPKACYRPDDDDMLAILAQAGRGKLLASSRLTPAALTNSEDQCIPGVRHVALEGLEPADAEDILRRAGVHGDGWTMRHFLQENFGCHPLSVGAVAGKVMHFVEARGDFDRWAAHPQGGAHPELIAGDLRQRQNHILAQAFADLDPDERALMGALALANIDLPWDVLRLVNPKRPIEPKKVDPAKELTDEDAKRFDSIEHRGLWFQRERSATAEGKAEAQAKLDAYRAEQFAKHKKRYAAYVAALPVWRTAADAADAWLREALPRLEARGLLQFDRVSGTLDLHPAIRHTALSGLSTEAKDKTGSHVADVLSSRPAAPFKEARSASDLDLAISRVEALNAAGRFEAAWDVFENSGLLGALFRLHLAHETLELMQPWFPQGWEAGPSTLPENKRADALDFAAVALKRSGKPQQAVVLYTTEIDLDVASEKLLPATLGNLGNALESLGQNARAARLWALALRLAAAIESEDSALWITAVQANKLLKSGNLSKAETALAPLRAKAAGGKPNAGREAQILRIDLLLAWRGGRLDDAMSADTLGRVQALGERFDELGCLRTIGTWHQENGRHAAALEAFGDLIALANEIGSPDLPAYEARRALSLAAIGKHEDARRIAERVNRGDDPPHVVLALIYLELGDAPKARTHALAGYRQAWGEGPPYHDHWALQDSRKVLAAIGEPEPQLPPFDAAKVEPFAFEPTIERIIAKKEAEKAKKEAERAAKEAERAKRNEEEEALRQASRSAADQNEAETMDPTPPSVAETLPPSAAEPTPSAPAAPVAAPAVPAVAPSHKRRSRAALYWLAFLALLAAIAAGLWGAGVTGLASTVQRLVDTLLK